MKLYVASSWRNPIYPAVLERLRADGHQCYDFRNPYPGNQGFAWSQISPTWEEWTPVAWHAALQGDIAQAGFSNDFNAMDWAEGCVLVMPSGRSAHLEAGWFAGKGKPCWAYVPEKCEPELMYLMLTGFESDLDRLCRNIVRYRIEQLKAKGASGG